jgi:uncharacterized protein YkwD
MLMTVPVRGAGLIALVAIAVACALPAQASPAPQRSHTSHVVLTRLESGVLQQLNTVRVEHRLAPLRLSLPLTDSADSHTHQMVVAGYFSHNSSNGTPFWKRIEHWYPAGHTFWAVGENLLWSSPNVAAPGALRLWMSSPEHRANILDPRWRDVGISAIHVAAAPGAFRGLTVTIITTDFGVRR